MFLGITWKAMCLFKFFFYCEDSSSLEGIKRGKSLFWFCFWFCFFLNQMQSAFLKSLQSVFLLEPFQRGELGSQELSRSLLSFRGTAHVQ